MLGSFWASLFSQLFQIVAFLLPLKVMILLGSPRVPGYFPRFLVGIERERLILLLAGVAVLLYLLHLLMEFVGATLARVGSDRLIALPQQGEELARQRKVALSLYQSLVTVTSGSAFAIGVWIFLGVFNPLLLVVVLGYFVTVFLVAAWLLSSVPALLERAQVQFRRVIDVLSACGFLLVFGFLVAGFLYGDAEGLLLGILTLLLCRQMFSRLAMALKGVERLYAHRERALRMLGGEQMEDFDDELPEDFLDRPDESAALLDGGNEGLVRDPSLAQRPVASAADAAVRQRLSTLLASERPLFWRMVDKPSCSSWMQQALAALGVGGRDVHVEQVDAGRKGELALYLRCGGAEHETGHYLFKMFNRKQTMGVSRGAALLEFYPGSSAVKLRTAIKREGIAAHLYDWSESARQPEDIQTLLTCREQAFIEACSWPVPEALQVGRQSASLAQRCTPSLLARCQAFSRWLDADTRQLVDAFAAAPLRLQRALEQIPLRLHNPDITLDNVYVLGGAPKVLRWENWTMEPVGSGWPLELGLERLDQVFARARESSEDLLSLSTLQVRLAALAFAFEERCARWAYLEAFALLGEIRDTLDALER
jgi:hypothetical protein